MALRMVAASSSTTSGRVDWAGESSGATGVVSVAPLACGVTGEIILDMSHGLRRTRCPCRAWLQDLEDERDGHGDEGDANDGHLQISEQSEADDEERPEALHRQH